MPRFVALISLTPTHRRRIKVAASHPGLSSLHCAATATVP
jgi:hypothetical protein